MAFDAFLTFDGNCRQAVEFYAQVFKVDVQNIMTYGQAPGNDAPPADKDRILYTFLPVFGATLMFSDCPSNMDFVAGNNIGLSLSTQDQAEITRVYNALKEDGTALMELGSTFYSELYGMVLDKFGITWHINCPK